MRRPLFTVTAFLSLLAAVLFCIHLALAVTANAADELTRVCWWGDWALWVGPSGLFIMYFKKNVASIPTFVVPIALAILPAAWAMSRPEQRRRRGLCVTCAYDLTGNTSGTCPECGTPIPQPSRPA